MITAAIFCFNINEFSPGVCVTLPRWLPQLVWPSQLHLSEETLVRVLCMVVCMCVRVCVGGDGASLDSSVRVILKHELIQAAVEVNC